MAEQSWYKRKIDKTSARLASVLILGALVAQWVLADTLGLVIGAVLLVTALIVFLRALRNAPAATDR
jgi:uncharacterized membrane protein YfcA